MRSVQQILAIARMEFRFSFRRSAPALTTALIGLLVSAGILVPVFAALKDWVPLTLPMTAEQAGRWTEAGFALEERLPFIRGLVGDLFVGGSLLAWMLMLLAFILLPMAVAAVIPADRRFGVMDVLRSTPITGSTYLLGKIMGVLGSVCLISLAVLALFLAVSEITLLAAFRFTLSWAAIRFWLALAVLDGVPLLVSGTIVGILAGVFFRTRRGAIFPGLLAGLASLYFWVMAFRAPPAAMPALDLVHYSLLQGYTSITTEIETRVFGRATTLLEGATTQVGVGQILGMYLALFAVLSILAILARFWLQWKENF